jgi:hypothetical protein
LAGEVRPEDLEQILATYSIHQALQLLIEKANAPKDFYKDGQVIRLEGGNDNISSILINISSNEPQVAIAPSVPASPAPSAKQPRFGWIYAGIFVALLLVGVGMFLTFFREDDTEGVEVTAPAAIVPPTSTVSEATSLPAVNAEVIVEQTATQPPQLTATSPATQSPTLEEAQTPTVTRVNTPTPVPPTSTPIPSPTATPSMTPTPTLTSEIDLAAWPTPVLIKPEPYVAGQPDFVAGQDIITFEWQWPDELPEGYGFEIRAWLPDNDPTGIYDVKELHSILQPLEDHKYSVLLKLAGEGITTTDKNYVWSVGLVQLEPYKWLNIESEQRQISIVVPTPGN